MDKQKTLLIAALELSIQKLEAGHGAQETINKLENEIQGIMDQAEVESLDWFKVAQNICGRN